MSRVPAGRLEARRRGLLAAALVLLVCGVAAAGAAAPPGGADAAGVVASATQPARGLSAGAPPAAMTLSGTPVHVPQPQPATSTVISGLAANGIPNVALNAYRVAAARMDANSPGCGIDWSLIAGIGRVESNHGRFGGATLNPDGTSTPKIIGPALSGVAFAFIHDTDGGKIDGDPTYDRAVGPMQFIPSTWRSYAVDGNGDGVADPFNINDAALAAAHYLCVAGGDLRTPDGQRKAVLAYNHSDAYVAQVLALAQAYASGIPVADLPISGDTSSAVPAPTGDFTAPAAPGPDLGASDNTTSPGAVTPNATPNAPQGGSGGQPSGGGAAAPAGSGNQPATTGGSSGTGTTSGTGTGTGPAPKPAPGAPQGGSPVPAGGGSLPAPPTVPAVPVPPVAPPPAAPPVVNPPAVNPLPLCSTLGPLVQKITTGPLANCRTS